jgi:hypothetical protein
MMVCYVLITALSATFARTGSAAVGTAVVPFLFIMYGFFSLAFTPLQVSYPVEIWPYSLRSYGLSTMWITTAIALFFNSTVTPEFFIAVFGCVRSRWSLSRELFATWKPRATALTPTTDSW